ncbi:MAG: tetraacyldisaccharide 4'-kinase [Bacteroidota bacterium]|nr:tetraacyldisaccharide 4'-kinase [Bacteroidota bacterium]
MYPLSLIYGLVVFIRNRLFDTGILKEKEPDIHTIGVGNLAVGGAGKTPLVEYLIKLLLQNEFKLATLSRGYKRKTSGYVLANETSSADDIGDEPLIYKSKYNIDVAVDGNRLNGVKKLSELEQKPNLILLDDVFQHRYIRCGLNIVVSDYSHPFFSDHLLPYGTLREQKNGLVRADIVIISKTPERTTPVELRNVLKDVKPGPHQQVFFSYLKYGDLYSITDHLLKLEVEKELFKYHVMAITGIANATPMIMYLKEFANEVYHFPFDDHHEYIPKELEDIQRYYEQINKTYKIIITTEKDLMRLKNSNIWPIAKNMNMFVLPVEVSFKDKEEEFNQIILKYARTNRFHHKKYS